MAEAEPLLCSAGSEYADEAEEAVSKFPQVPDRTRVLSFGGSGRLEEGPGSGGAAAFCLNITAAPSELTRTRMPRLEGAEVEGVSAEGVVYAGGTELAPPPTLDCLEVSAMLCRAARMNWRKGPAVRLLI